MKVKASLSPLKQTQWYEYATRFLIGGAITVFAGLVAKRYGPSVGGLFLAFPAIFPASATLIEKHEREKKARRGRQGVKRGRSAAGVDALGAAMGAVGLVVFAILTWAWLPRFPTWFALTAASAVWFMV